MADEWVRAGVVEDLEYEDVLRLDHDGNAYAVYRTLEGGIFATDGLCTHQQQDLSEGIVIGEIIECPLHQGRFHIPTGKAKGAPVCVDLATYKTKVVDREIYVALPAA